MGALMGLATDKGIVITDNFVLKYPTFEKFLSTHKVEKKNMDSLFKNFDNMFPEDIETDTFIRHNNLIGDSLGNPTDNTPIVIDPNTLQKIEFGPDGPQVLHPFFKKLDELSSNKKIVRIIHFGDSQIEGDRISGYLRQKLQSRFGGNGPGMIAAFNQYHTISFVQKVSDNFRRYSLYGPPSKEIKHKKFGTMGTIARFSKVVEDSLIEQETEKEAFIEIGYHKSASPNARSFNRVRMFYGNCVRRTVVSVYNNGELIHEDTLRTDGAMHVMELMFDQTPENLKYVFKSIYSPDFYGFSLDGNYGLALDNVAMRGESGTFVAKSDYNLLSRMFTELNAELFIMQFGGNTMPYLESEGAARGFANNFRGNLNALRKLRPNACIIVIGPSDMSTLIEEEYQSYPLLATLVSEMKRASHEAKAGYWDMYKAMGGNNSMLAWVEKGYAGEDYTHFTPSGARFVAEMFWKAFYYEYQNYKNSAGGEGE